MLEKLLAWALRNPEIAGTILTLLTGGAGAARNYARTGSLPLSTLPWRAFRRLFYHVRKRLFTIRRPNKRSVHLDADVEEVSVGLGRASYEPGWPLSYHYYGEDLNARRYYLDPGRQYPHRQLHVRGFATADGGTEIIAHEEPAPLQHPRAHLRSADMTDATAWVGEQWSAGGLDPTTFDATGD